MIVPHRLRMPILHINTFHLIWKVRVLLPPVESSMGLTFLNSIPRVFLPSWSSMFKIVSFLEELFLSPMVIVSSQWSIRSDKSTFSEASCVDVSSLKIAIPSLPLPSLLLSCSHLTHTCNNLTYLIDFRSFLKIGTVPNTFLSRPSIQTLLVPFYWLTTSTIWLLPSLTTFIHNPLLECALT